VNLQKAKMSCTSERRGVGLNFSYPDAYIMFLQEALGYIDISLADVISNKRINEKYHLIDSKNGQIQIELQWRTS
jgi:hypothetical protein